MTPLQGRLMKTFSALEPLTQHLLEILAVRGRGMLVSDFVRCARLAGLKPAGAKKLILQPEVLQELRQLADEKLILMDGQIVRCNPVVQELVARSAERGKRFAKWLDALKKGVPRRKAEDLANSSGKQYRLTYYMSQEDKVSAMRIAAYLNDGDTFVKLKRSWSAYRHSYHRSGPSESPLYPLFSSPFDAEWAMTRKRVIRSEALYWIAWDDLRAMKFGPTSAYGVLREEAGRGDPTVRSADELFFLHDLMAGEVDSARHWASSRASARPLLLAWTDCLEGDWAAAFRLLKTPSAAGTIGWRHSAVLLQQVHAALYAVAGLGARDLRQIDQLHERILAAAYFSSARYEQMNAMIRRARNMVTGGSLSGNQFGPAVSVMPSWHPLLQVFGYVFLTWLSPAKAKQCEAQIRKLQEKAASRGVVWIEAQLTAVLARLGLDKTGPSTARSSSAVPVPLVDAIPDQSPWERKLGVLEVLGSRGQAAVATSHPERVAWRVSFGSGPEEVFPYLQKIGKKGNWTPGRMVSPRRLRTKQYDPVLSDQDARVLESLDNMDPSAGRYSLPAAEVLDRLVGHPLAFRKDRPSHRIELVRSEPMLQVVPKGRQILIQMTPAPPSDGHTSAVLESPKRLAVTSFDQRQIDLYRVLGPKGLRVPKGSSERVLEAVSALSSLVPVHSDIAGDRSAAVDVQADARPHFLLTPAGEGLRAEPCVQPFPDGGPTYSPGDGGQVVFANVRGRTSRAERDLEHESRLYEAAKASCQPLRNASWDGASWLLDDPAGSLELLDCLHSLGKDVVMKWPEGESLKITRWVGPDQLALNIRKSKNWFKVDGKLKVDETLVLSLRELLDRMGEAQGRFLKVGDKEFIALSNRFRRQVEQFADVIDTQATKDVRFHPATSHVVQDFVDEAGTVDADSLWVDRMRRFRDAQAIDPPVPSTLQAELRDYQVEGFRWASRLAAWGAGACLADDMGLGKTLQALAVALERAPEGPSLVVAPTSVCSNWIDEARRFAPTLRAYQFGPGDRAKMIQDAGPFDLMICSYGLLPLEIDKLASVEWVIAVLDEAQAIKNRLTQRSQAAMRLQAQYRMILTGTPIENHLGELWNLFQYINPGLLGSRKSFGERFAGPIHLPGGEEPRRRLRNLIRPFVLRRTKSAVLHELPPRTDITVRVKMSKAESALYEALRRNAVEKSEEAAAEGIKGRFKILAEIMRLRRACCHPSLVFPESQILGSKLESFGYTVKDLIEAGHKALVFSQFVGHLKIVREFLDGKGITYRYLDGSTPAPKRKKEVQAFQAGKADLFLISLRAGGQGLNLTAADYVLHMDPWWNPAVEDQASDRAHRIGQTRPVTVYRFVMQDTIEEGIVDLHASKRDLADSLLEGTETSGKLSADELLKLMRDG